MSVKKSLENLKTDYIDLLYVHIWDYDTSIEEVMQSLHKLVMQGKVLYLVSCLKISVYSTLELITSCSGSI